MLTRYKVFPLWCRDEPLCAFCVTCTVRESAQTTRSKTKFPGNLPVPSDLKRRRRSRAKTSQRRVIPSFVLLPTPVMPHWSHFMAASRGIFLGPLRIILWLRYWVQVLLLALMGMLCGFRNIIVTQLMAMSSIFIVTQRPVSEDQGLPVPCGTVRPHPVSPALPQLTRETNSHTSSAPIS